MKINKSTYVVIMAGGKGERFWPRSRERTPKQLLPITSKKSMLQETVERIGSLALKENILIITNRIQAGLIKRQLPYLPKKNIIAEPLSKNTAPCIALAADIIMKRNGGKDAVMIILPADHVIKNIPVFKKTLKDAVSFARQEGMLVTLGVKPVSVHTGYGYIKSGVKIKNGFYQVEKFTEKPDYKTAESYIKSGRYYWNSGMFIWRADVILNEIKRYAPEIIENLKHYKRLPNISIDYAVMEKTDKGVVSIADFPWDDVGDWSALDNHLEKDSKGNILRGETIALDTERTIIISENKLVTVLGLKDMLIVSTEDAVLICPKDRSQEVKNIVKALKKKGRKYL